MAAVNWIDVASGANLDTNPLYLVGTDGFTPGPGALDFAAGETLELVAPGNQEITLHVGDQVGATGTVTIDGAGAQFKLKGSGLNDGGVTAAFGIDGGHGDLVVQNGGMFYINDASSAPIDPNTFIGGEYFSVGEDGGTGSVTVSGTGSQFRMVAAAPVIHVGRNTPSDVNGNSQASFSVLAGASLFVQDNSQIPTGDVGMHIGTGVDAFGNAEFQGTGTDVRFDAKFTAYLHVGDYEGNDPTVGGGSGVVNIGNGALVQFVGKTGAYVGLGRGAGANGELTVSGAGTMLAVHTENTGDSRIDVGFAGGSGTLRILDGAEVSVTAADGETVVAIGNGSKLAGRDGKLTGDLLLNGGGSVDLRDDATGTMTIDGAGAALGIGNAAFFDIGAASNDRIDFSGAFTLAGTIAVTLNAIGGYKFVRGHTKTIATFDGGDNGIGAYAASVTGQQADFSFYFGKLGANLTDMVVVALNDGTTASAANAGIVDYGTAGAGTLVYNAVTQSGTVKGGIFGTEGGTAVNLDDIRGTNGIDNFSVTGATARTLKFDGRGGNDTITGGAGLDTILGGAGNDVMNGGLGRDILNGGLGVDTYHANVANEIIQETTAAIATGGNDLVLYSGAGTFTLATNVERLTLTNATALANGTGNTLANTITGSAKNNVLDGGVGNDTLSGLGGNDVLIGGLGKDTLTGGLNNDTFKFLLKTHSVVGVNTDRIADFDRAGMGDDRIDVSLLFGPAMTYRHNLAFTKAGQVRINDVAGADVIVEVNTGGSLAADFAIRLTGVTLASMTKSDFVL